ncbi:MAG TPA: glycosyltransferase, partial [Thermoplasmata archaeon]|nr:glycosyltransferase [Thermoplasmata archaeon]
MGSSPTDSPLVSVVITVRNEARHIGQLLESLVGQDGPLEVVLVDSESRDSTRAIAESFAAHHPGLLRVIEHPGSRGVGRNVGVHEARGPWVAFIDGDCFADSQWVRRVRESLATSAVVAGRTLIVGKPRYGTLERVELYQQGFDVTYPTCNLA